MHHRMQKKQLGRTSEHRRALVAALVSALIKESRICTTLAKAKVARSAAERMVTMARKGTLDARRRAVAILRDRAAVKRLFAEIVPKLEGRHGGYTRITKLGARTGDNAPVAALEWVVPVTVVPDSGATDTKAGEKPKA
jgi:large subunit ribosomal protein L17